MAPPDKKRGNSSKAEAPAKKKCFPGHWSQGLLASMDDPELRVESDDKVVVIKDKYPKAKYHFLVLPKVKIANLKSVTNDHIPLLKHMQEVGNRIAKKSDENLRFKVGYHCIPSNDVVIVKHGRRICGSGGALANVPIVQNKAYFEIKVQCGGSWGVGLALKKVDLNTVPVGGEADAWILRNDGKLYHNNEVKVQIPELAQEGDIIGLAYDHVDLNFFLNGKPTNTPVSGLKGTLFPIIYVDDGAVLDVQFATFYHQPPDGFDRIMIEQSLL
ncbi:hypothetical protein Ahia01_000836500 [Argonauta hians]